MKTLILYSGTHGVTAKCAEELARRLGKPADVQRLTSGTGPDLAKYDEVILGSSVLAGNLQKNMKAFCDTHKQELLGKKLGLFVSCMNEENPVGYLQSGLPADLVSHAVVLAKIGGGFFFSDMNVFERFLLKSISKSEAKKKNQPSTIDGKTDILRFNEEGMGKLVAAFR